MRRRKREEEDEEKWRCETGDLKQNSLSVAKTHYCMLLMDIYVCYTAKWLADRTVIMLHSEMVS
jgi:hypothetical protein